ncbi:probable manganese-transporting ATPase pdr2 [Phtheirospermum japonicum]|uniref:Probable manganese-transporting ATPase pdr2 n=1 Tax=Phtheirospermum japonicum TaxID=374723 RepID=A0A830CZP7_9LAMI|nr:probable manganese-transporting ATPase pdr2 [Phtheirospermum japonicum]
MSRFHVGGKVVDTVDLLRKRHWAWRLDMWPFTILYGVWLSAIVPSLEFGDASIVLGGISAFHILVFLFTVWSVDFKCFVMYSKVNDIHRADACKITPAKFSGSKEVVPLHFRKLAASSISQDTEEIYFDFRKQRFIYSNEKNTFCKLPYPSKETIGYYLKSTGYGTEAKILSATEKWGRNVFEYPQPTFQKLMKEQIMEPFFVFQVFCVGLWCLDEYWYYSLFTLFMLFMFESTMAKSRLKTLTELRRVKVDSQTLMVYRCGKWVKLSGTELLPGDVVSIGRSTGLDGEDKSVPGDMLILAGSAIVNEAILTGESTPQWKVSVTGRGTDEKLSARRDKAHVLFGGTKILQHTPDKTFHLKAPDGGCVAVVLRTGFETSQGKLMRTILFSTERVTANSWESGLFILFLVIFALIAAGYVLKKGLEDPTRSKYKLLLSCSLIITSVIPPELPMELSIAVNTSLIALARRGIYCTEPFRIPFAGKVDICCFDKTGTLTSDDMEFSGVGGLTDDEDLETEVSKVPDRTLEILASCHALVFVDNKLVGDPLEKAALKGIEWTYKSDEKAIPKKGGGNTVQIVQRHHFASHLKRMAVVVRVQEQFLAFVKGAPETIQERLVDVPAWYVKTYKKYTRQGSRVLALAYKSLPEMTVSEARSFERGNVESDLTFAGFAVFNCPIRGDSASVLSELKRSSHDLVMITGDQALTACHVASQVNIISKPALILVHATKDQNDGYEWVSPDETNSISYRENEVEALSEAHDLCIGGDCLEMLQQTSSTLKVIPYVKVFARVAPEQKELIITTFKSVGRVTLMCGDGTNDVGALKQAHVGVALLNAIPPPQNDKSKNETDKPKKSKSTAPNADKTTRPATKPESSSSNRHLTSAEMQRQKLKKLMNELNEEGDGRSAPVVKLGDASMASPFTAKHASVAPTTDVIRQGRSTLVTTLQMFKILGLNCLATAYVLSVMYLDGVKLGDVQATISGIFTAAFFLFISHASPLTTLSAERPHPNIFCSYVLLSLLGQFTVHIFFLISSVKEAEKYMPDECIEPDSDFHPNLVNTVSYMVGMMLQVATFAVNYMGHPFNQSITQNRPFLYALVGAVGFFTVITSDLFRDLNDWLKLVPLPRELRDKLMLWAFLTFGVCYTWEKLLRWAFPGKMPAWRRKQRAAAASQEKKKA